MLVGALTWFAIFFFIGNQSLILLQSHFYRRIRCFEDEIALVRFFVSLSVLNLELCRSTVRNERITNDG